MSNNLAASYFKYNYDLFCKDKDLAIAMFWLHYFPNETETVPREVLRLGILYCYKFKQITEFKSFFNKPNEVERHPWCAEDFVTPSDLWWKNILAIVKQRSIFCNSC